MRYHNYILYMLRKEREMEGDFQAQVKCHQCGEMVYHRDAVPVLKYFGVDEGMKTIHFCNEAEANEYYLDCFRKEGG